VTFARLRLADWVAMLASLALLFVMASDWYGTKAGDEARRVQGTAEPHGALGGEVGREVRVEAEAVAEGQERNAWQEDGAADRLILVALLGTVGLAIAAGFLRAAGRRFEPPLTPSAVAALAASAAALLVVYRTIEQPGLDDATTVKAGAPLATLLLGCIALACAGAVRSEEAGKPFREMPPRPGGQGGAS
jgi:drug/metabolite transporter (DMT)-like permease